MRNINNWTQVASNIYRYLIDPSTYYEIVITCWHHDTDIRSAKSSLYFAHDDELCFEKEEVLLNNPVCYCLEAAAQNTFRKEAEDHGSEKESEKS